MNTHPVVEWIQKQKLKSIEGESRWYNNSSEYVPSVTTVLGVVDKGVHFQKWLANHLNYDHACAVRDTAAQRGTDVHNACEELMKGKEIDLIGYEDDVVKRVMCFEHWWKETQPTIVAVEEVLAFPGILYAGRFDFLANINGKNTLIDIKTGGHYKTHDLQASMYKILWDTICEHLGLGSEYWIDELYGLYLKDGWVKGPNPMYKKLQFRPTEVEAAVALWRYVNENAYGKVLKPKDKKEYKKIFKLEVNKNYEPKKQDLDNFL